jgi:hypothetical protein
MYCTIVFLFLRDLLSLRPGCEADHSLPSSSEVKNKQL